MHLLGIIAAASPAIPAQAIVRIQQAQRVTGDDWERSSRKREIVVREGDRTLVIRLIELE
jgi:hypothetical protein